MPSLIMLSVILKAELKIMNEYDLKIKEYEKYLLKLSKQLVIDIKEILFDKIINYQFKRTNSDIVIYLFEYGFELYDLTFYGLDKNFDSYTEPISLPTKFPKDFDCLTPKDIVLFEQEKFIDSCEKKLDIEEEKLFNQYLQAKIPIFENWFFSCWKTATTEIELKKGVYFSIHDTNYRIDLLTMKEIKDSEIMKKLNENN